MAKYSNRSPWSKTPLFSGNMGNFVIRPVSAEPDDYLYKIEPQYNFRPDLLAHDLYGSSKYWWVFTQRNMNVIEDPIFDFRTGVQIYIPKKDSLLKVLGS